MGHFNGYTFLSMQLRLKKNKHFEVSRWLLLKDFDLQSLFHRYVMYYLISLHNYFVIEMLRMRLFLYTSNLPIVIYQTTAFVEKQVMPLSVGENANRCWRERQSLVAKTPIASRDDSIR